MVFQRLLLTVLSARTLQVLASLSVLAVVLLLIAPVAAYADSELVLSADFHMDALREMPCSASNPGLHFEKHDYPEDDFSEDWAVEWQVGLRGTPDGKSPLYENLNSADFKVRFPADRGVTLHWSEGSHSKPTDFRPRTEPLVAGKPFALESFGGRSSDGVMPYFNLATEGGGLIVAVGWSGDWKAAFELLGDGAVRVTAGLKHSRFRLPAGEEVRLPSVLVMAYSGDWIAGQNQFRRLMLSRFTPKNHPPMDLMPVAASVHGMIGFNDTTEENLTKLARHIAALKLPIETFWLDAGWNRGGFPRGQGNPDPDPVRYPRGLGPVGKAVAKTNMRSLVWFEPERAMRGTWLDREHPDWLLSPSGTPPELRYQERDGFRLLDLANPDARRWAVDRVSRQIQESNIAIYRQDFNQYPAYFWQTGEPAEERGLREVRYITGLYAFLDELVRRHPGLILDNCASGGRRLDFEMMRRCVALWRSDSCWGDKTFPRNVQAMTHGLSHWLPLHGLGAHTADDVALRSGMGACGSFAINFRDPAAVTALRQHLDRYLRIRPLFTADFYPLTDWSDDPSEWLAFQFHDSGKGEGIIQAFCGAGAECREYTLKPRGLDAEKYYVVTNWDMPGTSMRRTGAELGGEGITVRAEGGERAVVLHYVEEGR